MIELELNNITKNYGLKNVLNGVNFEVKTGEKIALIGENGSGKSTIFKIISGVEKQDLGKVNIRKGATIGYLRQLYGDEEQNLTVEEYIKQSFKEFREIEGKLREFEKLMAASSCDIQDVLNKYGNLQDKYMCLGGYELEEKFKKICSGFKFDEEFILKEYNTLSGGQRAIVNLATILLKNPSILLLDEPTNHLDIETLEWLESFLKEYKGTVLVISHDRYFLDNVTTKTILLENGQTQIYFGNYSYFVEEDERRVLAQFEDYKNQQKKIEKMQEAIKKLKSFGKISGNERFFKRAKAIEKRLEKIELIDKREDKKIPIDIKAHGKFGKEILVINRLNKKYGENVVFKNFSLKVGACEKVQLKGKNGSGKSTLIKIILGKDNDFTGDVIINPSVKIGYIPQEIKFDNEDYTVLEYFYTNFGGSESQTRKFLAKYLFYGDEVFKRLKELSGGERVRLLIAKLVMQQTNFLILDEPTNHLDISTLELLEESLKSYKGTILFVSHDRYFSNQIANRIINI